MQKLLDALGMNGNKAGSALVGKKNASSTSSYASISSSPQPKKRLAPSPNRSACKNGKEKDTSASPPPKVSPSLLGPTSVANLRIFASALAFAEEETRQAAYGAEAG